MILIVTTYVFGDRCLSSQHVNLYSCKVTCVRNMFPVDSWVAAWWHSSPSASSLAVGRIAAEGLPKLFKGISLTISCSSGDRGEFSNSVSILEDGGIDWLPSCSSIRSSSCLSIHDPAVSMTFDICGEVL